MKKIFVHIEYLLLEHDCVIIPQLGGFLAKDVPGEWVEEESLFLPPYRTVRFNEHLSHGNTLLVDTLAQRCSITPAEAEKQVAQFVQHIRMELLENGSIDFGSIGVMMQEGAGQPITFSPCKAGVTTPGLYGLDSFHMDKICVSGQEAAKLQPAAPAAPEVSGQADEPDRRKQYVLRINRTFVHALAAAAASLILFVLMATPLANTGNPAPNQMQANLFVPRNLQPMAAVPQMGQPVAEKEAAEKVEEPAAPRPVVEKAVEAKPVDTPVRKPAPAKPASAKPAPKAQQKPAMAIVLASVTSMANAEAFAASLQAKGYDAHVYQKDKMVRVIIPCYENREAAAAKMKTIRENPQLKDAWLTPLE